MNSHASVRSVVLLTLAVTGLALPAVSHAQDRPATRPAAQRLDHPARMNPAQDMAQRIRQAMGSLNVSDGQRTQIEKILTDAKEQIAALRADAQTRRTAPQERQQQVRAIIRATRQKIADVLTPEQRKQFQEQMAQREPGEPGRPMLERLQKAAQKLELTDTQKPQIREIVKGALTQAQEIRQKNQGDLKVMREQMQALLRDSREKVVQLLTPEQSHRLTEMLKERVAGDKPRPRANRENAPAKADEDAH